MRRGEIWTVAGGKDHAGKPRPVVIVQENSCDATDSITICAFTTDDTEAPSFASLWSRTNATACAQPAD